MFAFFVCFGASNYIDTTESFNFNGTVVGKGEILKFTCELSQRPIGDAILFQVNLTTVDVIRHSNNTCYNRYTECSIDTCFCFYDGVKFQMEYWYDIVNVSSSYYFGVEILLKDPKLKSFVTVTLSRFYNGKGL